MIAMAMAKLIRTSLLLKPVTASENVIVSVDVSPIFRAESLIVTKETALIAVVGYTELALATRQAAGNTKMYLTFFLVTGAIYLAITLVSQQGFLWLERRVRRGQRLQA